MTVTCETASPLWACIGPPLMATSSLSCAPDPMPYSSRQYSSCSSTLPWTSCCWYTGIPGKGGRERGREGGEGEREGRGGREYIISCLCGSS